MARIDPRAPAAAIALAATLIGAWEGWRNDPYADLVGKMTVCAGETRVPMRHYTDAECKDMLAKGLLDYRAMVLKRSPGLAERPYQLGAAISLTYNIGGAAYARSTVAKRFDVRDWRGGCNAFMAWRFAAGREVRGLARRREAERQICLRDLP